MVAKVVAGQQGGCNQARQGVGLGMPKQQSQVERVLQEKEGSSWLKQDKEGQSKVEREQNRGLKRDEIWQRTISAHHPLLQRR